MPTNLDKKCQGSLRSKMVPQDLHYTRIRSIRLASDACQSYTNVSIQPPKSAAAATTTIAGTSKDMHCLSAMAPEISSASNPFGLTHKPKFDTPFLVTAVNDSAKVPAEQAQKLKRVL